MTIPKAIKESLKMEGCFNPSCDREFHLKNISEGYPVQFFETVFDIGCGDGYFLKNLINKGFRVLGIDIQKNKYKAEYGDFTKGIFSQPAHNINFSDNCSDLTICIELLEYIPECYLEETLQELHRVSKKALYIVIDSIKFGGDFTKFVETLFYYFGTDIKRTKSPSGKDIFQIQVEPAPEISDMFTPLSLCSQGVQTYKSHEDFCNMRQVMSIQNFQGLKRLGYVDFKLCPKQSQSIVLVGAGSGLKNYIDTIKDLQDHGASVWTCNHVVKYLYDNGITPDYIWGLESREALRETLLKDGLERKIHKNVVLHGSCHPTVLQEIKAEGRFFYFGVGHLDAVFRKFLEFNNLNFTVTYPSVACYMLEHAFSQRPKSLRIVGYDFYMKDSETFYDKDLTVLFEERTRNRKAKEDVYKETVDGVEFWTSKQFISCASRLREIIAKSRVLNSDIAIGFQRLGSSPVDFIKRDESFLQRWRDAYKIEYQELLDSYSLLEIVRLNFKKHPTFRVHDTDWMMYLIPDKINTSFNLKDYTPEELFEIKKLLKFLFEAVVLP